MCRLMSLAMLVAACASISLAQSTDDYNKYDIFVKEQGLALVRGKDDERSRRYVVGLSVTAAIVSSELGLAELASSHKTEAESLLLRHPELDTSFPGLSEADRQRYNEIHSAVKSKVTVTRDSNPPPRAVISGGVLNAGRLNQIEPDYPATAREAGASGLVAVRVVIDETGKVIWARAVSGHELLRKSAEEAAWQTKFHVTKLSGRPVTVAGVLRYNFVP